MPEATSSFFLPKLIGYSRALHLLTTGETVLGNDKLVDGLFSEVVDRPDQVLWRAYDIAEKIAVHSSAVSAYLVEAMVWHVPNSPEETHLLDSRIMAELYRGAWVFILLLGIHSTNGLNSDKKDGIDSFLEKRTPIFRDTVTENLPSIVPWWKTVKTKVPLVKGKL